MRTTVQVLIGMALACTAPAVHAQARDTTRRVEDIDAEIARLRRDLEALRAQQRAQARARAPRGTMVRSMGTDGQQMMVICESGDRPQGWLGVTFAPPRSVVPGPDGPLLRFAGPIVVEEVSPNSPAARAGIAVGDSITVMGSEEVKGNALNFQTLLKPGVTLPITLRRAGKERSFKVDITQRPGSADGEVCREIALPSVAMARQNPVIGMFIEGDSGNGIERVRIFRDRAERAEREARSASVTMTLPSSDVPAPPRPPGFSFAFGDGAASFLFGAQVSGLTDDLAELTGVKKGVFVVSVADGSPAASGGLRGADVIQKVGDVEINTVRELRRALAPGERSMTLSVIRKKKPISLTVSW